MKDDFDIQIKDSVKTNQISLLNRFSPQKPRRFLLKQFNQSNSVAVLLFNNNNSSIENKGSQKQKELISDEPILCRNEAILKVKLFKKTKQKDDHLKNWGMSSLKNIHTKLSIDNDLLPKFDRNPSGAPSINNIPFTNAEILASFQSQQKKEMSSLFSPINDYLNHHSLLKLKQKNNEGDMIRESISGNSNGNGNTKLLANFSSYPRTKSGSHLLNKYLKNHSNTFYNHYGLDKAQDISLINKKQTHNSTFRCSKTKEELSPEYLETKKKIQIILKRKTSDDKSS